MTGKGAFGLFTRSSNLGFSFSAASEGENTGWEKNRFFNPASGPKNYHVDWHSKVATPNCQGK
jgi:hypothetical protein